MAGRHDENPRDRARSLRDLGVDPAAEKQRRKAMQALAVLDSFERAARAWHAAKAPTLVPRYAAAVLARLENNVFPSVGKLPLREITPPLVLDLIRTIEARQAHAMAHRVLMHISDVFVWGIASGIAASDPAAMVRKALKPLDPRRRPAVGKIDAAKAVLRAVEALPLAHWASRMASRLLALTAARPGVIRLAEWHEFEELDGDQPLWRVPAAKMKLTQRGKREEVNEFLVPLSRQAVDLVRVAMAANPPLEHQATQWLFPGFGARRQPISDSTLSGLYLDAGLRGLHVPHGWRSSFSTIMNRRAATESRAGDQDVIDLMLAHVQRGTEPIYNRYAYMPQRRALAQAWADMLLEGLPGPETLLSRR
jgi:Phage integrase family